jgi:hypothetical protein
MESKLVHVIQLVVAISILTTENEIAKGWGWGESGVKLCNLKTPPCPPTLGVAMAVNLRLLEDMILCQIGTTL